MLINKYLLSSVASSPDDPAAPEPQNPDPAAALAAGDQPNPEPAKPAAKASGEDEPKPAPAPKPPKARNAEDVFRDRNAEQTRHRREAERKLEVQSTRAEKLEAELRAAQALLEARGKPEGEGEPKPGETKPASPRPVLPSLDELLESPEALRKIEEKAAANARASEISRRGDEIYEQAEKEFGASKIEKAMGNFKAFDGLRTDVAEAIFEVPEAHKVLFEIGSNPAEIERLYKLAETSPTRMAIEVAKISNRIAAKPAAKKVSDVPEPPDPVGGRGNGAAADWTDPNASMSAFVAGREADLKKRGVRL